MEEQQQVREITDITIDDLRKIKRYEKLTDEQAEEILFGLEQFGKIIFEVWKKQKRLNDG